MAVSIWILSAASIISSSVRIAEEMPAGSSADEDYMQYDDNVATWYVWDGMFRGVWFDANDFFPGATGWEVGTSEYWMFEGVAHPWDISTFYAEIWSGGVTCPTLLLDQQVVTAIHFAPCFAYHYPGIVTETCFWVIENTEMSSGGWPSLIGDETPPAFGDHSFYSDDFITWVPWANATDKGDFFIRVEAAPGELDQATWGQIKSIF